MARAIKDGETVETDDLVIQGFNSLWEKYFPIHTPETVGNMWKQYNPEHGRWIVSEAFRSYKDFLHKVEILHAETVKAVNLFNETTNEKDEVPWFFGLKIDLPYKYNGKYGFVDWKSTGMYAKAEGIQPNWIASQVSSDQFLGYTYGEFREWNEWPDGFIGAILVHTGQKEYYAAVYPCVIEKRHVAAWKKNFLRDGNEIHKRFTLFNQGDLEQFPTDRGNCFMWNRQCTYRPICDQFPDEAPSLDQIFQMFPEFEQNFDYVQDYIDAWDVGNVLL